MGDDCNVAPHRRSENSPSSFSPTLPRIKDPIEEPPSRVRDMPAVGERDYLLMASRQSGEPGEGMYKIADNKHVVVDNDLPELTDSAEPMIFIPPSIVKSSISAFPYIETKLRPDAPPFTPESLSHRSGPEICETIVDNIDPIRLDPIFVPRTIVDDTCFVNIELRSTIDEQIVETLSNVENQNGAENKTRDYQDTIIEPEFKLIDVNPSRLKRTIPKIVASVDSGILNQENTNENNVAIVATETGPDEPETRETRPEIERPNNARGHWRIIRTTFILSNRIQIVVFIASLVICMILVIYVVV